MMMSFNDVVHKHKFRKSVTSKLKLYQVLSSLGLSDVGYYLKDGSCSSELGIVNLHPRK